MNINQNYKKVLFLLLSFYSGETKEKFINHPVLGLIMGLEKLLENAKDKWLETSVKLAESPAYQFGVDVLSGWLYYTPTYAAQELAVGKDVETVIKTRLIGLVAQAVAMRPVGLLRNYVAKKWGVTKESSLVDQMKVNLVAVTPPQAIVYGGMLAGGMAWSGNYDLESSLYAWGVGVGLGTLHSIPYGFVQDKVRKFFGVKPAIRENEISSVEDKTPAP